MRTAPLRHGRATAVALGLAILLAAMTSSALGQEEEARLDGKVRAGGEVIVPADETVPDNLYVSGGTIRIEGDVEGDLVAAGGQIQVNGTVGGDALLAGGNVGVAGEVAGSTRVAGGQVLLTGLTGEDVAAAAGRVRVGEGAGVGQDLLVTAGAVRLDGTVDGDVLGSTGDYEETGTVMGETRVAVREPAAPPTAGERVLGWIQRYAALLLVGALLLWLAPRVTRRAAGLVRRQPFAGLGAGALTVLAAVVGSLAVLVVGALLAALLGALGLGGLAGLSVGGAVLSTAATALAVVAAAAFIAPVLVGLWLGAYALDTDRGWLTAFGALALGTLVVVVLTAIPFVGGAVAFLVALLGIGALALLALRRLRERGDGLPETAPQAP